MLQYAVLQHFEDLPPFLIRIIKDPVAACDEISIEELSELVASLPSVAARQAAEPSGRFQARVAAWVADLAALKPRMACSVRCVVAAMGPAQTSAGRSARRDALREATRGARDGRRAAVSQQGSCPVACVARWKGW